MASGPKIVNFSIPAGDVLTLNIDISPDATPVLPTLLGSNIYFNAWKAPFGLKTGDPVIHKALDHGIEIDDPDLLKYHISFDMDDTIDQERTTHYFETTVVDGSGNHLTPTIGIMTITEAGTGDFTATEFP